MDGGVIGDAATPARNELFEASVIVVAFDIEELAKLADVAATKVLILNKVDLVAKPSLLGLVQEANARMKFAATFMVSARSGDGIGEVKRWLAAHVPPGPWHYPEDQISDAPMRSLARASAAWAETVFSGRTGDTMVMVSFTASKMTTMVGRTRIASGRPIGSGLGGPISSSRRTVS